MPTRTDIILRRPATLFATFALLIGLAFAPPAHGQTIHVDASNTSGTQDGQSWSTAYPDLQTAIDNAPSNDEIWVAEDVHTPGSEGDSFTITGNRDELEIYGGFAGTESSRSARAPKVHRTILSGDINRDDTDPDGDGIIEDDSDLAGGRMPTTCLF